MKRPLLALHKAIALATKSGEAVALELDVDRPALDALAFTLGYSFSWVELPGSGWRLEGEGKQGAFALLLHTSIP